MRVLIRPEDITRLENAGESLARLGDLDSAVSLWALALRFRAETGIAAPPPDNVIQLRESPCLTSET